MSDSNDPVASHEHKDYQRFIKFERVKELLADGCGPTTIDNELIYCIIDCCRSEREDGKGNNCGFLAVENRVAVSHGVDREIAVEKGREHIVSMKNVLIFAVPPSVCRIIADGIVAFEKSEQVTH